jgi:hypothetical protein
MGKGWRLLQEKSETGELIRARTGRISTNLSGTPFIWRHGTLDAIVAVDYASAIVDLETRMHIVDGLLLLATFVGVPLLWLGIGYAAWKGKWKSFDHESYVLGFVACLLVSLALLVYAQNMQADVRTWQYLLQIACFGLGLLLFGIAGGCFIGIFARRFGSPPAKPPE